MKKICLIVLVSLLALSLFSCGKDGEEATQAPESYAEITLSQSDKDVIEAIGDDVHVVSDADYADTVKKIGESSADYSGQVYQLVGKYTTSDVHGEKVPYLYNEVNGERLGLQLNYVDSYELKEGQEIRVTAIVAVSADGDHSHVLLDVIAIESPAK